MPDDQDLIEARLGKLGLEAQREEEILRETQRAFGGPCQSPRSVRGGQRRSRAASARFRVQLA